MGLLWDYPTVKHELQPDGRLMVFQHISRVKRHYFHSLRGLFLQFAMWENKVILETIVPVKELVCLSENN